ncbi:DUF2142 domain-containing protein [Paenibacillus typhae]|uniref:DUF2142 domain-containing protein n=1 Tax=Paenibacillus typhae TaxID=1174501 RepID=UPI001C8ED9C7|nr:DUF2142 domain-containing protein [Paenibacillus typhae]MBY0009526.1 DUF2142 domain-containing protein [Paenibacillus typhae]
MDNAGKIEYKFLSLALIFGLLFVFLIPPLQAADEDSHFKKSYLVSSLHLFAETNADGRVGNYIPQSIMDFENNQRYIMGNMDAKYSYKNQYIDTHVQVDKGESVFIEYSTSKTNPILFIPQAIGMFLIKVTIDNPIFNLNDDISPINYLYAGRISNLFFYVLLCFFAIRTIPFMKNTLFLLCLMPMNFSLAASLSYDGIIIGTLFLFISFIFKFAYDADIIKLNKSFLYSIIIFSIVIIQLKQIYYPLMFLILLIPLTKYENKKQRNIWFVYTLVAGVLSYAVWGAISKLFIQAGSTSTSSLATEQVKFILGSPIEYLHILLSSINNNLEFYFISFVGNLGWLDTNFPYVFTMLYFAMLIISAIFDKSSNVSTIDYKHKLFILGVCLSVVVLIETALYVIWTSVVNGVGSPNITGVQGRYFIPISISMLIILKNNYWKDKFKKINIHKFVDFIIPRVAVFSLILTLIILLLRYWIPGA